MRTSKIREFNINVNNLNECSPDSIWVAPITKSESQEQCFLKYSKFGCLWELNCFNINFDSEIGFQIIKICRNVKFQGVWAKLKINQSPDNSGQNILDKLLNLREKDLAVKSFDVDILYFLAQLSKFLFCVASCLFLFILYLFSNKDINSKYLEELKEKSNFVQKNLLLNGSNLRPKEWKNLNKIKKDKKLTIDKS